MNNQAGETHNCPESGHAVDIESELCPECGYTIKNLLMTPAT